MKNFLFVFLSAFLILTFSCKGTPPVSDQQPLTEIKTDEQSDKKTEEVIEDIKEEIAETEIIDDTQEEIEIAENETDKNEETEQEIADTENNQDEEIPAEIASAPISKSMEDLTADPVCTCCELHPLIQQLLQEQTPPQVTEQVAQPTQPQTPIQPQPPVQPQPQTPFVPAETEQSQIAQAQQEAAEQTEQQPETSVTERIIPPFRNEYPSAPAARIEPAEGDIVFSRVIRVTVGQIIEIPFRGNGWVYLGELASRRGIVYNSRRSEPEGMSFIFSVEEPGTYALKFYREDFTRGYIINDYVQIIAGEAATTGTAWFNPLFDRSRVVAEPRWPTVIEEAEMQRRLESGRAARPSETAVFTPNPAMQERTAAQDNPQQTTAPSSERTLPSQQTLNGIPSQQQGTTQTPPSQTSVPAEPITTQSAQTEAENIPPAISGTQENISPNMLLQRAKETFDSGNVAGAIALLDQYMMHYPNGSDEAYWFFGQFYEANSPSRNILLSIDYYKRLVNEYPQSNRINDARRRIAYLERFYINIR